MNIHSIPNNLNNLYLLYDENENIVSVPESIAIILDGNGRYAEKMHIPRKLGHKAGCETLEKILEDSVKIGVKFLTVYAFSTENWKRSEEEINALFDLFFIYLNKIEESAMKNNVKVSFIGDLTKFPDKLIKACNNLSDITKDNSRTTFIIAFNYGGRDEIVRATKKIIDAKISSNEINENVFSQYLDTKYFKNPDLLIRTSGELRLSNFLLWQLAYSEFYITNTLWPEFTIDEFHEAIYIYNQRKRRFGGR